MDLSLFGLTYGPLSPENHKLNFSAYTAQIYFSAAKQENSQKALRYLSDVFFLFL